jgi:glucose-6-phosphate isomerase
MNLPEAGETGLRLPDDLAREVAAALQQAVDERWAERLWARDTSLWTDDEEVAQAIVNRLGWLDAPAAFADEIAELTAFAGSVRGEGYTDVIVCGMGGSSLAPEVLVAVCEPVSDGLTVRVLDSTDPAAVRLAGETSDPATTLRIIATKSGTTTETLAFLAHFWDREHHRVGRFLTPASETGLGFVAITDPERSLAAIPHADLFREAFLDPPDVGGRYSALTYVGLVPAALAGLDLEGLIADAARMAERCALPDAANPGLALGVAIGTLARGGRDKLTFVIEPALAPLGAWLEQLIAESTGKRGTGIVPVDGEPLGAPSAYRDDRVFVRIAGDDQVAWREETGPALDALAAAGHPVIDLVLRDVAWVGGEFMRWEVATAVAGAVLGVDPFDEPNVTESKTNTANVLARFAHDGHLPVDEPIASTGVLRLTADGALASGGAFRDAASVLRAHLDRTPGDGYVGIGAYIAPTPQRTAALRGIQALIRDRTRAATTLGYGPRYLHSTGQLHKGGRPTGCFLQLVAGHPDDLPIPGRKESFGILIGAQALGDFASLGDHGLPVLRVHLSDDPDAGLEELRAALEAALA